MKCLSIIGQEYQTSATSHIERFGPFVSFVKKKGKEKKKRIRKVILSHQIGYLTVFGNLKAYFFLTFCRLIGFLKKNKIISN